MGLLSVAILSPLQAQFTEYPMLTVGQGTRVTGDGITVGPDGALWFTEPNANKIGRIAVSGSVTEYSLPTPLSYPSGITSGPDGALWFTEYRGKIGRITSTGTITEYPLPPPGGAPYGITSGPDGALWFTADVSGTPTVGRITASGSVTEYPVSIGAQGITAGPDGAIWFAGYSKVGRIAPSGTITSYATPPSDLPTQITAGPDGALWLACSVVSGGSIGRIARVTVSGSVTAYTLPNRIVQNIAAGPDGALWFTEISGTATAAIGRISTSGAITEYFMPVAGGYAGHSLSSITAGPDGALWFTDVGTNQIGRYAPYNLGSMSPVSTTAGGSDFTLTVTGGAFAPSAVVQWNGSALSTNYVDPTQLAATVPASLIAGAGVATITVSSSAGTTNGLPFGISTAGSGQVGVISTVAGSGAGGFGSSGFSGDGGPATSALLNGPQGVAVDASGSLFIADFANDRIRKVSAAGLITTIVGTGKSGFSGDNGPASAAQLSLPEAVAVDHLGNLYIADSINARIRKVSASGIITTFAGGGSPAPKVAGQSATSAALTYTEGVAVDASGNVSFSYADINGSQALRVSSVGVIVTVIGNGTNGFVGDGGPAATAELYFPYGVAADAAGNLFIADRANNRIRKVSPSGVITTVVGNGSYAFAGDGGLATSASLSGPEGVVADAVGNLFVADTDHQRIRKVSPLGIITTVAGNGISGLSGDGGLATSAQLSGPWGLAVDASGNLFIADYLNNRIRKVSFGAPPSPSISVGGVVPVGSAISTIQPGEWVSIYGSSLAASTVTWSGNFPTSLGGTSVTIDGKPAYLSFVSPTQINVQAPDDSATGTVPVVVTTPGGTASSTVTLAAFAPSFLLLDSKHVAGIIPRANGSGAYGGGSYDILGPTGSSLGYPTVAAKAGDTVELFAVGLGSTSPGVPAGQAFSGTAPTTNTVSIAANNANLSPSFAGLSGAGLYQINLTIPAGLGSGDVPLSATVGGARSQPGVVISLQ